MWQLQFYAGTHFFTWRLLVFFPNVWQPIKTRVVEFLVFFQTNNTEKMRSSLLLLLFIFVQVFCASNTVPVPLLVWSGKSILKEKNAHHTCTAQRAVIEKWVKKSLENKVPFFFLLTCKVAAIVFFVNNKMGSDQFMTLAGSFGGASSVYPHLKV